MSTQGDSLKAIADAIRAKDGTTDVIQAKTFPSRIRAITTGVDTGDATATAEDILSGKTAYGAAGKLTGSMQNQGEIAKTLSTTGSVYTIPKGYHPGTGKVTASITNLTAANVKKGATVGGVAGTFTEDATAAASDIASGKTAYVNGSKIVGSVNVVGSGVGFDDDGSMFLYNNSSGAYVEPTFKFPSPTLFRSSYFNGKIPLSEFGDATVEDVAAGKIFTSASGLSIVGSGQSIKTWQGLNLSSSANGMYIDITINDLSVINNIIFASFPIYVYADGAKEGAHMLFLHEANILGAYANLEGHSIDDSGDFSVNGNQIRVTLNYYNRDYSESFVQNGNAAEPKIFIAYT